MQEFEQVRDRAISTLKGTLQRVYLNNQQYIQSLSQNYKI